jgi:hypothetical protein
MNTRVKFNPIELRVMADISNDYEDHNPKEEEEEDELSRTADSYSVTRYMFELRCSCPYTEDLVTRIERWMVERYGKILPCNRQADSKAIMLECRKPSPTDPKATSTSAADIRLFNKMSTLLEVAAAAAVSPVPPPVPPKLPPPPEGDSNNNKALTHPDSHPPLLQVQVRPLPPPSAAAPVAAPAPASAVPFPTLTKLSQPPATSCVVTFTTLCETLVLLTEEDMAQLATAIGCSKVELTLASPPTKQLTLIPIDKHTCSYCTQIQAEAAKRRRSWYKTLICVLIGTCMIFIIVILATSRR